MLFNFTIFLMDICDEIGFWTPFFVHYAMKRGWTLRAVFAILLCAIVGFLFRPLFLSLGVTSEWHLTEGLYIEIGAAIAVIVAAWHLNEREGRDL